MSNEDFQGISNLELLSVVGFAGKVPGGLLVHPDRQHLIYALGDTVIIEKLEEKKSKKCPDVSQQVYLRGHTDNVTCIAVSNTGKYIASGQQTHMGFKADIIVWDFEKRELCHTFTLHKVKVQALAFSPNDLYLVSLGGQDDGSVVLWNIHGEYKEAICGSQAGVPSAGVTNTVAFSNNDDNLFFTAGKKTLRIWNVDVQNRKIRPIDCNLGQLKRDVNCIQVSEDDQYFYCGTTTGDILVVSVGTHILKGSLPKTGSKYSQGVTAIQNLKSGNLLIGCGDGTVEVITGYNTEKQKRIKSQKVEGAVTSLALRGNGHQFFVGTSDSNIYKFNYDEFSWELIKTSHLSCVNDIVFPFGWSDVFATCSKNEIRVWCTSTSKELVRIEVPNINCGAIDIMRDGKSIVSGWDDNKIRAFAPQSGKLLYEIADAHNKGVTALAITSDNRRIISGGGEGQVRVWTRSSDKGTPKLTVALKEHKGAVTCIKVRRNDQECISSSEDSTCIIWDLEREVRSQVVFANTMFKSVCYNTSENQFLTAGTDRKIAYWETFDGSQIRELEGSKSGSVEGMDISCDGNYFVTGGTDKLIKVWTYDQGEVTHVGIGHCGDIVKVKICPNSKYIISVSNDGGILWWKYPHHVDQTRFGQSFQQKLTL